MSTSVRQPSQRSGQRARGQSRRCSITSAWPTSTLATRGRRARRWGALGYSISRMGRKGGPWPLGGLGAEAGARDLDEVGAAGAVACRRGHMVPWTGLGEAEPPGVAGATRVAHYRATADILCSLLRGGVWRSPAWTTPALGVASTSPRARRRAAAPDQPANGRTCETERIAS